MSKKPPAKAVALRYDPNLNNAPRVVAKGTGTIAENIIRSAKQNEVALEKNESLVEVLNKLELNDEIPTELYQVVAEILSFVYRTDRELAPKE